MTTEATSLRRVLLMTQARPTLNRACEVFWRTHLSLPDGTRINVVVDDIIAERFHDSAGRPVQATSMGSGPCTIFFHQTWSDGVYTVVWPTGKVTQCNHQVPPGARLEEAPIVVAQWVDKDICVQGHSPAHALGRLQTTIDMTRMEDRRAKRPELEQLPQTPEIYRQVYERAIACVSPTAQFEVRWMNEESPPAVFRDR